MSFTFTKEQLSSIIGNNSDLDGWYEALSTVLPEYEIDTPNRIAAFIAQCNHESGGFKRLKENLNYISRSSLNDNLKEQIKQIRVLSPELLNPVNWQK